MSILFLVLSPPLPQIGSSITEGNNMRFKFLFTLAMVSSSQAWASFTVHEWGTFTSLVGADGSLQQGMFGEDEPLPSFV
ncbi:hypothetical protein EBU99_13220, partial [bacterium]|nr:hypothetical protein [bacterium]